jgi:peptidoglycan/LPS O-acetylase OafA/YrhL
LPFWSEGSSLALAPVPITIDRAVPTGASEKIATGLYEHRPRVLLIAYLSVVCAAAFPIILCSPYALQRGDPGRARIIGLLGVIGGVLFIVLHAVSDIGITGLLGAKLASFGHQHDPGVSYTLYLMTFCVLVFVHASSGIMLRRVPPQQAPGASA